ncbi:hypothetical protein M9Y10_045666 [Tritrichomonas musculus]|uniref:Uncharacterized protein n=1 Tax=Tritrichomonas musculus TaxID=1915356 RepID=A0ABR2JWL0_9EUKA
MFGFNFKNNDTAKDLIKILSNPDTTVETVLSHEQLAIAVRNESKNLINFFYPPNELGKQDPSLPHLKELLDFALTTHNPDNSRFKIYQINRNASNILSQYCSKFFKAAVADKSKLVFRRLRGFMFDDANNTNHIICGHYQRIIENYLSNCPDEFKNDYGDGFTLDKFTDFIIEHASIFAYRELLSDMMSEFTDIFGEDLPDKVLRAAARSVLSITSSMPDSFKRSHQFTLSTHLKSQKYTAQTLEQIQPINVKKKIIPLPDFLYRNFEEESIPPMIINQSFFEEQKRFVNYPKSLNTKKPFDQIILHVYSLLSSVRLASVGITQIIQNFQKEESIRYLLICGVYSDSNSSISTEAFRLLRYVIYGYDDIQRMREIPKVVDDFAANFVFEPDAMTTQMFAAFPIFWNYRYEVVETATKQPFKYKDIDPQNPEFNNDDRRSYPLNLLKKSRYRRPKGKTPLELLTPIFFSEPPLNTTFNIRFMEILERLDQDRRDILGEETDVNKLKLSDQKKIFEIDQIYFEFLRNKFDLNHDNKNINVCQALQIITPLVTTDKYFHPDSQVTDDEERLKKHRVPFNGQIFQIFQFIFETKLLEPSDEDQGIFYIFIPERNQIPQEFYKQMQKYKDLMDKAMKNAVRLDPPNFDDID